MYGATQDVRFKQRTDYIVAELRECQVAEQNRPAHSLSRGQLPSWMPS